jgi:DNA-binding CsgD family transcriptional regulator
MKGGHPRNESLVQGVKDELANLDSGYPTLQRAIEALREDIYASIKRGQRAGHVYKLVARRLQTSPHTVRSVLQRAKRRDAIRKATENAA